MGLVYCNVASVERDLRAPFGEGKTALRHRGPPCFSLKRARRAHSSQQTMIRRLTARDARLSSFRFYDLLVHIFVVILLISNLVGQKMCIIPINIFGWVPHVAEHGSVIDGLDHVLNMAFGWIAALFGHKGDLEIVYPKSSIPNNTASR